MHFRRSPQHPALFAAVDGTGRLDLWDLNSDTEVATASVVVEGAPALNRVSWTQSGMKTENALDFAHFAGFFFSKKSGTSVSFV